MLAPFRCLTMTHNFRLWCKPLKELVGASNFSTVFDWEVGTENKEQLQRVFFQSLHFWRGMETILIEGARWVWPSTCLAFGWLHTNSFSRNRFGPHGTSMERRPSPVPRNFHPTGRPAWHHGSAEGWTAAKVSQPSITDMSSNKIQINKMDQNGSIVNHSSERSVNP